jgi:hypothetical protein
MDKDAKMLLKAEFKKNEREALEASIPMKIDDLKELLSFLNRASAPACDHTLKETQQFLESRNLDARTIVPWLKEHGGHCDCEAVYNVYDDVGDIVGWHLDEEAEQD